MKNLFLFFGLIFISSCSIDSDQILQDEAPISWRSLPTYILPYQDWSTSDVLTQTSDDLDNWAAGYVASTTTASLGTSSTMYLAWNPTIPNPPFDPGGYEDRPLTIFQNGFYELRWVEMNDAGTGWTTPAPISDESSTLLPSVEVVDGVVVEVHVDTEDTTSPVRGSNKSGATWNAPVDLFRTTLNTPGFAPIASQYSPTVEYHPSVAVEYLTTADLVTGSPDFGDPRIFWRYTATNYTETLAPNITLGTSNDELVASFTPVALTDNGDDFLYVFYTDPGTSSASENEIKYVIGSVTGSTDGTITLWSSPETISSAAITTNKIDAIFNDDNEYLIITYRNSSTNYFDVAYSTDFGDNWTIESNIARGRGAPSICNIE